MEGEGAPPEGGQGQQQAPQSFDQAAVDRIVEGRLAKERAKFADYDDLKGRAAKWAEHEEQTKSEHQKALDKARSDADRAARDDERGKANMRILTAEVKAAAGGRFADPADAVRFVDLDSLKPDADGNYDAKAVASALDKVLEAKPYLAGGGSGGPTPRTGPPDLRQGARGQTPPVDGNSWLRDAARRARG